MRRCTGASCVSLTSAWPPAFRSLLQRSHLRHNLCQSLPSDDTFSAAHKRQKTEGKGKGENIFIKEHCYKVFMICIVWLCWAFCVPFNNWLQQRVTSPCASLSRIKISLYYISGKCCPCAKRVTEGRGDTGDACVPHRMLRWCHCRIDRQWAPIQLEQQGGSQI